MTEQEAIMQIQSIPQKIWEQLSETDNEAVEMAFKALEEIQQYRAIGTPDELKQIKENGAFTGVELAQLAAMNMKLKKYQAIGTPDVWIALVKQKPKKPTEQFGEDEPQWSCPICGHWLYADEPYCDRCGQKIDWSDAN